MIPTAAEKPAPRNMAKVEITKLVAATTVVEPKKFVIETENVTIQVDPQRSDLIEMKKIDGRRYVLIAVEGEATMNGVEVNIP